jgi:hypothetical protein
MAEQTIAEFVLNSNLSFTAILLTLIAILIPLYVAVKDDQWKKKYKGLFLIFTIDFTISVLVNFLCLISKFNIILDPSMTANVDLLIVVLYILEFIVMGIGGICFLLIFIFPFMADKFLANGRKLLFTTGLIIINKTRIYHSKSWQFPHV